MKVPIGANEMRIEVNDVWKDIPGYEGLYEASLSGKIRNVKRGRILKQSKFTCGYGYVTLSKKKFRCHRLIMLTFHGESELTVDHINGDKMDNRLVNLRYMTQRDNNKEYYKNRDGTSKFVGVSWRSDSNKYRSVIRHDKHLHSLGSFDDELQAAVAYKIAETEIQLGVFA